MRIVLIAFLALGGAAGAEDEDAAARAEEARVARERQEAELLRKAQLHFDAKNHAAAARALERVLATRTEDAAALALLGHCYFEIGDLEKARAAFTRAVGRGRLTKDVVIRLAHIAREQGAPSAAASALRLAHLLVPKDAAVLGAAGDAAAAAGMDEEAASAYRAAVDLDPARADAHLRLGNIHIKAGAAARALTAFETAHHLGASSEDLARLIAELHVERGQLLGAVAWYERMLRFEPEDAYEVRLRCARLQAAAGDLLGARDRAGKLTGCPDKVVAGGAHLLAGRLASRAKDPPAAVGHWLAALALGQGGAEVHGLLGVHYHRVGEHAKAAEHLDERLRRGPPDSSLSRALIRSRMALSELPAARAQLVLLVAEGGLDEQAERLITELAAAEARKDR
jgi:tetratricopeptide (TPR) repeat protein